MDIVLFEPSPLDVGPPLHFPSRFSVSTGIRSSPIDVESHNTLSFETQRSRWHSFLSLINVGSHNSPPFETQHPHVGTCSFLQSMWYLTIHSLSRLASSMHTVEEMIWNFFNVLISCVAREMLWNFEQIIIIYTI